MFAPIRCSKPKWTIQPFAYHECSARCSVDCQLRLVPAKIHLATFDADCPKGFKQSFLCQPDQIIIPESRIECYLYSPYRFIENCQFRIDNPNGTGFTLRQCLFELSLVIKRIFYTEEQNADVRRFVDAKPCTATHIEPFVEFSGEFDHEIDCSICRETFSKTTEGGESIIRTNCEHFFHHPCITQWLKHDQRKRCPNCRMNFPMCDLCHGNGTIYNSYYAVLPRRDPMCYRPKTYGP